MPDERSGEKKEDFRTVAEFFDNFIHFCRQEEKKEGGLGTLKFPETVRAIAEDALDGVEDKTKRLSPERRSYLQTVLRRAGTAIGEMAKDKVSGVLGQGTMFSLGVAAYINGLK